MRARSWVILLGGTLLLAGGLIATWVLWRDLFVWALIIAPILILIVGLFVVSRRARGPGTRG